MHVCMHACMHAWICIDGAAAGACMRCIYRMQRVYLALLQQQQQQQQMHQQQQQQQYQRSVFLLPIDKLQICSFFSPFCMHACTMHACMHNACMHAEWGWCLPAAVWGFRLEATDL